MYSRVKLRKKDLEKNQRYIEIIGEVYDKLETEWEYLYQVMSEQLQDKEKQLKNERILRAVNTENYNELQDRLNMVEAENRVLINIANRHGVKW